MTNIEQATERIKSQHRKLEGAKDVPKFLIVERCHC